MDGCECVSLEVSGGRNRACRNKVPPPGLLGMTDLFSRGPEGLKSGCWPGSVFSQTLGGILSCFFLAFGGGPCLILGDPWLAAAPSSMQY